MAPFNPEIRPTNDPNYGSNSRAVDTPDGIRPQGVQQNQIMPEGQKIGDRSAEYEGQAEAFRAQGEAASTKGFGDLFANIVGIADFMGKAGVQLVKKDIENKVYEVASAERSAYTAELEKIKEQVGVRNIITDAPTTESGEAVPEAVSDLGTTLATLKSARDGGKITKTDYWGRLDKAASEIRNRYPGFKAEIDAEFQKVTGQNPANARINGLVTEINRAAAAAGSGQNKTLSLIKQNLNMPGAQKLWDDFTKGRIDESQVVAKISGYQQKVEGLKMDKAMAEDKGRTIEERQTRMGGVVDKAIGMAVSTEAERLSIKYGFDTPENAEKLAGAQRSGVVTSQFWEEASREVNQAITRLEIQAGRDVIRTGAAGALKGGQKEANERIQAGLDQLRSLQKGIIDKDAGTMHSAKRESTAIMDDQRLAMYKDSKLGPMMTGLKLLSETGAEQYVQKMVAEQTFGKNGISDAYKDFSKNWAIGLQSQNKNKPDGTPLVYNDFIEEMKLKKVDDPIQQSRITKTMVDQVSKIGDSTVPDNVKANLIKAAFSTENNGFLSKLNMDTYDERGRPVAGMNAVFQKWTAPEVTNEIKRLSKNDPKVWNQYTDWVKTSFSTELVPRELADLSKFQKDPNIKIDWNVDNQRFDVTRTTAPQEGAARREGLGGTGKSHSEVAADNQQFLTVQRSLFRINNGMANMKHIAGLDNPGDKTASSAFLLRAIVDATSPEIIRNLNTLPGDLVSKILIGNASANRKR